ncbi:hypothetical protein DSM104443_00264 [Usitatibacter rugosus]|uniref:Uncharacterized protein n=1 Tax=Usitatibacter rugosus TaxID=2732067 RepID=A0A6M4GUF4_9PROT|nr:hypothetical protein [Usitatibacter rugosus]QJR09227.1 hypothetical protein DSM104443_00264 [Usitatibacter rugosus]
MTVRDTFEIGRTYFVIRYMDEQLLQPIVETLVYLGPDTLDGESWPTPGHLFQFAASYHRDGNWNELPEAEQYEYPEPPIVSFSHEHREYVLDTEGLVAELREWQARA